MWQRLKPAFSLFLLAPLIGEYLLGSLSFGQLGLFPLMALMYGAGALFVRELARRSGRGWPTLLLLGLAYGVIEEGLITQSLFNPHYLGLHLLDYGFIPALGLGASWTAYVIILHVMWSIAVPVGFVEGLFPERRTSPWLGKTGFAVTGAFYLLGAALIAFGSRQKDHFAASGSQLAWSALVATLAVVAAFVLCRRVQPVAAGVPASASRRPLVFGGLAFAAGSLFHLVAQFGGSVLAPGVAVGISLLLPVVVFGAARSAGRSGTWTDAHTDALVLGGLLAYCWLGFFLTARLHGTATIPGQFFPFTIVLVIVYRGFVRPRTAAH